MFVINVIFENHHRLHYGTFLLQRIKMLIASNVSAENDLSVEIDVSAENNVSAETDLSVETKLSAETDLSV
jgi:hypothetical protein